MLDLNQVSFGAELEFADIPQNRTPCPEVWRFDTRDVTMVNSNGIAVDAKGKFYKFGGEINMLPTNSMDELAKGFQNIIEYYPEAQVNHRTGLHIHIHVPGLKDNLKLLKRLQLAIHTELREVITEIEPLPKSTWRRRSHQTFLSPQRLKNQLDALNVADFFRLEVPHTKSGKPMWHAQPRCAVNVRQLKETDTVEFRHFSGTINAEEFEGALTWCNLFMEAVLEDNSIIELWKKQKDILVLPKVLPYSSLLEERYLVTCWEVPAEERKQNIAKILNGTL